MCICSPSWSDISMINSADGLVVNQVTYCFGVNQVPWWITSSLVGNVMISHQLKGYSRYPILSHKPIKNIYIHVFQAKDVAATLRSGLIFSPPVLRSGHSDVLRRYFSLFGLFLQQMVFVHHWSHSNFHQTKKSRSRQACNQADTPARWLEADWAHHWYMKVS